MRWIIVLVLLFWVASPARAELAVVHGGRTLVTFDVPGLKLAGRSEGLRTRMTFTKKVGKGQLEVTVNARPWIGEDKADTAFREDQDAYRRSPYARVGPQVSVPGAARALTYSTSEPFQGMGLIIYTEEFRCQLLVTGTGPASAQIRPVFKQLLKTVQASSPAHRLDPAQHQGAPG